MDKPRHWVIQSVLISRDVPRAEADQMIKRNSWKVPAGGPDDKDNYHRYRQIEPQPGAKYRTVTADLKGLIKLVLIRQ